MKEKIIRKDERELCFSSRSQNEMEDPTKNLISNLNLILIEALTIIYDSFKTGNKLFFDTGTM